MVTAGLAGKSLSPKLLPLERTRQRIWRDIWLDPIVSSALCQPAEGLGRNQPARPESLKWNAISANRLKPSPHLSDYAFFAGL